MNRILVVGAGGAGKSTFARTLAERCQLPLIHLDAEFWQPGWVELPREQWIARVDALIAQDRWILDGNFGGTLERRLAACDTVVFLDLPPLLCVWRVIRRRLRYHGRARPDMTVGCKERLSFGFLWLILSYRSRRRPQLLDQLALLQPNQRAFVLPGGSEMRNFVDSISEVRS